MAAKMPRVLKNFNLFVDGRGYAGRVAEATPPKLSRKMEDYRGGGMAAPVGIDMGLEKLAFEFSLKEYDEDLLKLWGFADYAGVALKLKGALQADDTDGTVTAVNMTLRGRFKELDWGNWKAGEEAVLKASMELSYFKYTADDEDIIEIDALGMVENVGGTDRLEAIRQAIGE